MRPSPPSVKTFWPRPRSAPSASARDPVDDGDALAVPHGADALDAHAGHEAVHGGEVRVQVLEPGDEAVAIAEADRRRGDAADRRFARGRLGIGPRREPGIRGVAGAGVQAIGDRGREHRQLVAPALDVRIARRDLREGVPQVQPRRRALRLERDRDLRAARLRQLRAGRVAVGEDDAPRRIDLQHLAGHLDAVVVADEHPSAGPRVDGGPGAPPGRPQRAVGEVLEDGVDRRADVDGAFEEMREGGHGLPL